MGMLGTFFGQNPFGALANTAGQQVSQATGQDTSLFAQGQNAQSQLSPYFSNLLKDPQGLGATTMSQMMTQAGQGTAGATGAATRTAADIAARTGNTAALPAAIGGAQKAGLSNLSGVQNDLAIKNAMTKLSQQQQGAEGLSGLMGKDISGASSFGELANKALGTELSADEQKQAAEKAGMSNMLHLAGGVMGAIPGNPGGAMDIGSNILGGL